MLDVIKNLFIYFMIYSFLGWLIEMIWVSLFTKKIANRGFLIGPYCPIYGVSSISMILLLSKYKEEYLTVFVLAAVICSVIEYITSYVMEKVFKARWWNYSNRKFNVNGRICLRNSALFGILGVALVCFVNPYFESLISTIGIKYINTISIILAIIFITDNIISFNVMNTVKKLSFEINKDNTNEISKKVKEILFTKSAFTRRLAKAFPELKLVIKQKKEEFESARDKFIAEVKKRAQENKINLQSTAKRFKIK